MQQCHFGTNQKWIPVTEESMRSLNENITAQITARVKSVSTGFCLGKDSFGDYITKECDNRSVTPFSFVYSILGREWH